VPPHPELVEVHGKVGTIDGAAGTVIVGDRTLSVDDQTVVRRGRKTIQLADLVSGEPAVALAVEDPQGELLAKLIQVWPRD
jgi:hypothetical protein